MKTFEFTIIASGFDSIENFEDALFEAGCGDATFSLQKGVLIGEFDRDAVSFSSAVASACRDIKNAGLVVERIEPDHLVSLSEIADRAKLGRQAIYLYAKGDRRDGFPSPAVKVTSKHPLWDWGEVSEWLFRNNLIEREAVVQAKVVKEANTHLTSLDVEHDGFLRRLELHEMA